jgi:hypothetical protein
MKRVFIPIIVGDYEAITAELEKIECKELRENLVSPFAIHMNRKDYASNDRKIFNEKIRPKINSIIEAFYFESGYLGRGFHALNIQN